MKDQVIGELLECAMGVLICAVFRTVILWIEFQV